MLNWGSNMDWFSVIKIDKDKIDKTVKFLETGGSTHSFISKIVEMCGKEIWLGEKIPTSFIMEIMRLKNKTSRKLSTEQAVFISNFTIAGSKILSLYKVPDVIKKFLRNKKQHAGFLFRRRGRDRIYTSSRGDIFTKKFSITYMARYETTKAGPNRKVNMSPIEKNTIIIKTRLFVISIPRCTIDEFIALKKGLKTFLPSLNAYLLKTSNNYRNNFERTHDVTNEPVEEIKIMYSFASMGPNPFKRKDDKDNNGDVVAS